MKHSGAWQGETETRQEQTEPDYSIAREEQCIEQTERVR
jgi:hypothetical protein